MSGRAADASEKYDWGVGVFGGKFYDSALDKFLTFKDSKFLDQYMVGVTVDRTIWHADSIPLSLQIEGMTGVQFGKDSLGEVGVAPRLT
jgi:hypothetical protein